MIIPQQAIADLCQRYGVAQLYVFGSAATPRFDPAHSDIDVLATLLSSPPLTQGEALLHLCRSRLA